MDKRLEYIKNCIDDLEYTKTLTNAFLVFVSEDLRAKEITNFIDIKAYLKDLLFEEKQVEMDSEQIFIEKCEQEKDVLDNNKYKLFKMQYDINSLQILFNETKRKIVEKYKKEYPDIYELIFKNGK